MYLFPSVAYISNLRFVTHIQRDRRCILTAVNDLNLRIAKILKKTPMEDDDRQNLVKAVDTAAGKVVNKLIFGLRDSLNQEVFLECVAGLEKIYEE